MCSLLLCAMLQSGSDSSLPLMLCNLRQQAQADCDASTNQAEVKKLRAEIKALTIENEE